MKKQGISLIVLIITVIVLAIITTITIMAYKKSDIINESKDIVKTENINRALDYAKIVNDDIESNLTRGINIIPDGKTRVQYIMDKLEENKFTQDIIDELIISESGEIKIK